jgi:hypothetical protein
MRAFLKQFGLFIVIQLAIGAAVFWSYRRQYPAAEHFLAASIDKHSLIRTQAPPRLIFVGGSSMAFGVNSAQIAAACGRHPVNMGLYAAVGLKFMLREVAPCIQAGDWIVVAPEHQHFARLPNQSEMLMNMVEIDPSNARLLDAGQWAEALDRGGIQRIGKITRAVLRRPGHFFRDNSMKTTRPFYRRIGFNHNGDMVAHLTVKPPKMTERQFQFRYREELVSETIAQMNQFARLAEGRGAKAFFSHPPVPREVFDQNREQIDRLESHLQSKLLMPQLDRVEELVFPITDFFDTLDHLAAPGVEKRSKLLASRVAEQAKDLAELDRQSK